MSRYPHRVAVTGVGVVAPNGLGFPAFAEALAAGRSGIGPITLFSAAGLSTRIAGQVPLPLSEVPFRDRKLSFALRAAKEAMAMASRSGGAPGGEGSSSLSLGLGLELFSMEDLAARRAPGFVMPEGRAARLTFLQTPSDLCLHMISKIHGLTAPPLAQVSACAAGADAIGAAFRMVAGGRRRWMLAGGADSMVNPMGVGGFCKLSALSTRNDEPERASRPFDKDRDGFVLGEGAALLVLERLEDARARGAEVLGELLGFGNSFDAHAISEPHPRGAGAAAAMRRALADAGLGPEAVDAINAHGTSTRKNDPAESAAIAAVFGARAGAIPISATKSMTGHLIGAAGAIEAAAALASLRDQLAHPTINLEEPDADCPLDYVPLKARPAAISVMVSNAFGFGGQNAALVLGSLEHA